MIVALLGRRLAGERAGLIAAGIAAIYPTLIAADGALMSETLYGLLTQRPAFAGRSRPASQAVSSGLSGGVNGLP